MVMKGPFYIEESPSKKWSVYIEEGEGALVIFYSLTEKIATELRDRLNVAIDQWDQRRE